MIQYYILMVLENTNLTVDGTTYSFSGEFSVRDDGSVLIASGVNPMGNPVEIRYTVLSGQLGEEMIREAVSGENIKVVGDTATELVVVDPVLNARSIYELKTVESDSN